MACTALNWTAHGPVPHLCMSVWAVPGIVLQFHCCYGKFFNCLTLVSYYMFMYIWWAYSPAQDNPPPSPNWQCGSPNNTRLNLLLINPILGSKTNPATFVFESKGHLLQWIGPLSLFLSLSLSLSLHCITVCFPLCCSSTSSSHEPASSRASISWLLNCFPLWLSGTPVWSLSWFFHPHDAEKDNNLYRVSFYVAVSRVSGRTDHTKAVWCE